MKRRKTAAAAAHHKELIAAKAKLRRKVRRYTKQLESAGVVPEFSAQLNRLLELKTYRARDIARIESMLQNKTKLAKHVVKSGALVAAISGHANAPVDSEKYAKRIEAAKNKGEFLRAKDEFIAKINQLSADARSNGYSVKISPQVETIAGSKYSKAALKRIRRALQGEKIGEYLLIFDERTGDYISGGEAFERYERYLRGPLAKKLSKMPDAIQDFEYPAEAEIKERNFIDTVADTFHDNATVNKFIDLLNKAENFDTTVAENSVWTLEHNALARASRAEAERTKQYWMNENVSAGNMDEIRAALSRVIEREGVVSLVNRLDAAGEELFDDIITAAIGYQEAAGRAVQRILQVLLPNATRAQALAMSDFVDSVDDFGDYDAQ